MFLEHSAMPNSTPKNSDSTTDTTEIHTVTHSPPKSLTAFFPLSSTENDSCIAVKKSIRYAL